jgi:hypothetical protein
LYFWQATAQQQMGILNVFTQQAKLAENHSTSTIKPTSAELTNYQILLRLQAAKD